MTGYGVSGQAAVVIGAGAGIGAATAFLLGARGMAVACVDKDRDAARALAASIAAAGGKSIACGADIADPETVISAFTQAAQAFGQLHAAVNCAGIQGPLGNRSHEVELSDVDRVYAVNLRGALAISQTAVRHMLAHRYGRIAHVASIAGKEGNPGMIAYSITKAGLIGMVKAQGKEYAKDGITINALAPAVIDTGFLSTQPSDIVEYMLSKIPMGRAGTTDEAAQILAWMVSPECSFTTGFTFDLSGGRATY